MYSRNRTPSYEEQYQENIPPVYSGNRFPFVRPDPENGIRAEDHRVYTRVKEKTTCRRSPDLQESVLQETDPLAESIPDECVPQEEPSSAEENHCTPECENPVPEKEEAAAEKKPSALPGKDTENPFGIFSGIGQEDLLLLAVVLLLLTDHDHSMDIILLLLLLLCIQ